MDLDDAAEELYAVAPGTFLATRKELAARARAAGDRPLVKQIDALRRPTVAAWLVNQLVRDAEAGPEVDELIELGDSMREAQNSGAGPQLRELTSQRRSLVTSLVGAAERVGEDGGQNVTAAVQRELEETFGAVVADPQAAEAVASGRLTRSLSYAGFGDVDLSEAIAAPTRRARLRVVREGERAPSSSSRSSRSSEPEVDEETEPAPAPSEQDKRREREREEKRERERAAAREAVDEAEAALSTAEDEAAEGDRERAAAQERQENAERDVADLESRLKDARAELTDATDEARRTDRDLRRLERAERDARTALRRAEVALARLDD